MIGDRIKEARTKKGFSQEVLAQKIGVSKRTLINYEKNEQEPTVSTIINIANFCTVNEAWLLTGKEENKESTSVVAVNLYKNIFTSAGYGTINSDLTPIKINLDKDFLKEVFNITDFKNLDIIRVTGDSMLPHIKDGEYVFVQKGISPKNGDTIIANIDGELYIKRYHKLPFEKWFRLESDNKEFPNIEIDTDDKFNSLIIVGIVKSKIKLY